MLAQDPCNPSTWGVGGGSRKSRGSTPAWATGDPCLAFCPQLENNSNGAMRVREQVSRSGRGYWPPPPPSSFLVVEVKVTLGSGPRGFYKSAPPAAPGGGVGEIARNFDFHHLPLTRSRDLKKKKKSSFVGTFVPLHYNYWAISKTWVSLARTSCKR